MKLAFISGQTTLFFARSPSRRHGWIGHSIFSFRGIKSHAGFGGFKTLFRR